jgi:Na+-translocating ferredoxin:NAD+ oxidoreductase RnfC subunit
MDDFTKILTAIFGTVAIIAIAAVIVGKKSQAPQAIQSIGSSIGNIVAAAVNPVSANYGYGNGNQAAVSPTNISTPSNAT